MINRIFLPRTGHFDWVSERDMIFMEHLIDREALNIPYIMMIHIREAARKIKACLPYGIGFTMIFEDVGIDLTDEIGKPLHHSDTDLAKSLRRIRYHLQGVWLKKLSG